MSFVVVGVEVQEDELVDEGQESFFVTLEVPPGERGVCLTRSNSTVTIFDDDGETWSLWLPWRGGYEHEGM